MDGPDADAHGNGDKTARRSVASAPTLYRLVTGGRNRPRGDAVVTTFTNELQARAAFREVRLRLSDREGWAELMVEAGGARPRMLSWFGDPRGVAPLAQRRRSSA
jgi:hypothetical protein